METKIASYQEPGIRLQLIEITLPNAGQTTNTDGDIMYCHKYKYQIRLNRKIVYTTEYENIARTKFATKICSYLTQIKINYE